MNSKQTLTKKKGIGYCLGDIFGGGAFTLVGMLYMNFLTDNMALSGAVVAAMLFIGKIWDAIIDPFIGNISEKTHSKMGKRRIFFFAGIFHIGAAFIALWLPLGSLPTWLKAIYFTFAYMLFATSFSLTMVPYHAMLPELTDDLKKRNRIVSLRSIFSNCSSMIAGLVPTMLVSIGSSIGSGFGYLFMGICFAIFYTIPWIFVFKATKGLDDVNVNPDVNTKEEQKSNIFKAFFSNAKTVLSNRSFRIMLGLYLLSYTAMDIFMAIFIYYVKWYMKIYGVAKVLGFGAYTGLLGIFMVSEVLSIPVYTKLANKIGKKTAFMISTLLWAGATIVLFFMATPDRNLLFLIIPACLMGFGAGGVAYLPWAMLPETMDVEELISGKKKDGIYSGFLTFIRQLSQAVALAIVGLFLDAIDYDIAGIFTRTGFDGKTIDDLTEVSKILIYSEIPDSIGNSIKIFTTVAPCILLVASSIIASLYPISINSYTLLKEEINNRNTTNEEDIKTLRKIAGKKWIK